MHRKRKLKKYWELLGQLLIFSKKYLKIRFISNKDTGEFKGSGFCEYAHHETAESAVRNLNGYEY